MIKLPISDERLATIEYAEDEHSDGRARLYASYGDQYHDPCEVSEYAIDAIAVHDDGQGCTVADMSRYQDEVDEWLSELAGGNSVYIRRIKIDDRDYLVYIVPCIPLTFQGNESPNPTKRLRMQAERDAVLNVALDMARTNAARGDEPPIDDE